MIEAIRAFLNRIQSRLRLLGEAWRLVAGETALPTGLIRTPAVGSWSILDGLTYQQPIPLPSRVRQAGPLAVAEFAEALLEAYPDWARTQFGTPYLQDAPVRMLSLADPLAEWDETVREDVLEQCHLASERNPIAKAAVNYTRLFAVGQGSQITYRNPQVEEICTAFLEHDENDWEELEGQLCEDAFVDGELFIRFHAEGEEVVITTLPPWSVRQIDHEPGFFRRPTVYHYRRTESDGAGGFDYVDEKIPADEVLHFAINRRSYEQRGRPDLFAILPWLKGHKQLLENLARNVHFTNILYDVTMANATATQVAARMAQIAEPPSGATVSAHNDKETWQKMDTTRSSNEDVEVGRQLKMMAAVGVGLPEYFLSDGENANLASATAQQMPAIKTFEDWQAFMTRVVTGILRKALELRGLTEDVETFDGNDEATGERVKPWKAFEVQYPKIDADDPKSIMEALNIGLLNDTISQKTAIIKSPFGLDPDVELKQMDDEREADIKKMRQGLIPMPPGFGQPNGNGNGNGGGNSPPEDQPPPEDDSPEEVPAPAAA